MDYIIDFYKNLDSLNLIIFWGVIIVIILLLVFSIIMINKNRKLKYMLYTKAKNTSNHDNINIQRNTIEDIPIKEAISKDSKEESDIVVSTKQEETKIDFFPKSINETTSKIEPIVEEKKFVAEEYINNYKNEKDNDNDNELIDNVKHDIFKEEIKVEKPEINIPNKPYQKNILREMSLNQTSPIGITTKENKYELEKNKAQELTTALSVEQKEEIEKNENKTTLNISENSTRVNSFNEYARNIKNPHQEYLKEVSEKLQDAKDNKDMNRTEYEIKQEEDAIISYEELMQKKDQIKIVDEEEAVISIGELLQRENNKLYNITENEENDKFINELKHFRGDL